MLGGWSFLVVVNLLTVTLIGLNLVEQYVLGDWTESASQHENFTSYCCLYVASILGAILVSFVRMYHLQYFAWFGHEKLHSEMIESLVNAPVNLFFDKTPVGRILVRMNQDFGAINHCAIYFTANYLHSIYSLISIVVFAIYMEPAMTVVFALSLFFLHKMFKFSIEGVKEIHRIEHVTHSPLATLINETISGSETIRAYGKKDLYLKKTYDLLNRISLASQWREFMNNWFHLRMDLFSSLSQAFVSLIIVQMRFSTDPILLCIMLTQAIRIKDSVGSFFGHSVHFERVMIHASRCLKILEIPQE